MSPVLRPFSSAVEDPWAQQSSFKCNSLVCILHSTAKRWGVHIAGSFVYNTSYDIT